MPFPWKNKIGETTASSVKRTAKFEGCSGSGFSVTGVSTIGVSTTGVSGVFADLLRWYIKKPKVATIKMKIAPKIAIAFLFTDISS